MQFSMWAGVSWKLKLMSYKDLCIYIYFISLFRSLFLAEKMGEIEKKNQIKLPLYRLEPRSPAQEISVLSNMPLMLVILGWNITQFKNFRNHRIDAFLDTNWVDIRIKNFSVQCDERILNIITKPFKETGFKCMRLGFRNV